jgi:hypothetical protein
MSEPACAGAAVVTRSGGVAGAGTGSVGVADVAGVAGWCFIGCRARTSKRETSRRTACRPATASLRIRSTTSSVVDSRWSRTSDFTRAGSSSRTALGVEHDGNTSLTTRSGCASTRPSTIGLVDTRWLTPVAAEAACTPTGAVSRRPPFGEVRESVRP